MTTPENLRYSQDHMWMLVNGYIATIGMTHHAQNQMGEIVFIELSKKGSQLLANDESGTVESVKSVIEIFTPVSGEVTEVNEILLDDPSILNDDPYGEGWMIKIKMSSPDDVKSLMTAEAYETFCKAEAD